METGEPSLPKKARAGHLQWTSQENQLLMRLLVDGIRRGWRDSNGSMTKTTVEAKILPVLNKQLGCNKSYKHYMNRMKSLKKEYNGYAELFRCSSGLSGTLSQNDSQLQMKYGKNILRDIQTWKICGTTLLKILKTYKSFLKVLQQGEMTHLDSVMKQMLKLLKLIENDVQEKEDEIHTENVTETNETTRRASKEKLPSRKRAKPNGDGDASESINPGDRSEKELTEMIGVSTNIMNLMQQREERHQKEAEEKEAEKRKNNVWDAIKEIPDLEQDI